MLDKNYNKQCQNDKIYFLLYMTMTRKTTTTTTWTMTSQNNKTTKQKTTTKTWTTKTTKQVEQKQQKHEQQNKSKLWQVKLYDNVEQQLEQQRQIIDNVLSIVEKFYERQKRQCLFEQDRLWLYGLDKRLQTMSNYIIKRLEQNDIEKLQDKKNYYIFKKSYNKYIWLLAKQEYNNIFLNDDDNDDDKTTKFIDYKTTQDIDNINNKIILEYIKKDLNDKNDIQRLQEQEQRLEQELQNKIEQQQQIDIDYYKKQLTINNRKNDKKKHDILQQLKMKYNDFFYWQRQLHNHDYTTKTTYNLNNDLNYWQKLQQLEQQEKQRQKKKIIIKQQRQKLQDKLQEKLQQLELEQQQLQLELEQIRNNYNDLTNDKQKQTRQKLLLQYEQQQRQKLLQVNDKIYKTKKQLEQQQQQRLELLQNKIKKIGYHKKLATYRTKQHRLHERQKRHTKAIEQQLELEQQLEQQLELL